jgi:hypothetical protein
MERTSFQREKPFGLGKPLAGEVLLARAIKEAVSTK